MSETYGEKVASRFVQPNGWNEIVIGRRNGHADTMAVLRLDAAFVGGVGLPQSTMNLILRHVREAVADLCDSAYADGLAAGKSQGEKPDMFPDLLPGDTKAYWIEREHGVRPTPVLITRSSQEELSIAGHFATKWTPLSEFLETWEGSDKFKFILAVPPSKVVHDGR